MSKRGGFPGMGGFGGMNINNLMKEAKKMQADLEKSQSELAIKEFEASAGGNAVTVKVNGQKQILSLNLQKEVVDPDDVEMSQDLIITCLNQAFKQVDDAQTASMGKFNKGLTSFGKKIIEMPENMSEITKQVSIEMGKQMRVVLIDNNDEIAKSNDNFTDLTKGIDIPINIID